MKRNLLLFLFCGLFSFQVIGQEVPEVQKSLITKRTATWCPFCGTWGWTFFEDLIEDNSEKALLIAAHYSGELLNPTANAITSNFGGISQPRFYLGNDDQGVSSGNIATKREQFKVAVDNAADQAPVVNAGLTVVKDNDKLTATVKTQFFQNTDGAYYVGVYIIEDAVVHFQSSIGDNASHHNLLQAAFTEDAFGELVAEGTITAGAAYNAEYEMVLDPTWNPDNITVATIVWKKEGDDFTFVNTHFTDEFGAPTSLVDIELKGVDLLISPTVALDQTTVMIENDRLLSNAQLILRDLSGKTLSVLFDDQLQEGAHSFQLSKSMLGGNGLYFLSLESEGKVLTKRLIFQ